MAAAIAVRLWVRPGGGAPPPIGRCDIVVGGKMIRSSKETDRGGDSVGCSIISKPDWGGEAGDTHTGNDLQGIV